MVPSIAPASGAVEAHVGRPINAHPKWDRLASQIPHARDLKGVVMGRAVSWQLFLSLYNLMLIW